MDKITVKFIQKDKRTETAKTILGKKWNKLKGIGLLDFKTYTVTVIKTVGIGREIDTKINGTEQRIHKETHINMPN